MVLAKGASRASHGRRPLAVANWKMNKRLGEAEAYIAGLLERLPEDARVEIAVAPAFVHLAAVVRSARGHPVAVAAQNCHGEASGSFTGEVSAEMLRDVGASAVILGHSERRRLFAESDDVVRVKVAAAVRAGLHVILCVGETLGEREEGLAGAVLRRQVEGALGGVLGLEAGALTVAYEPVWAIGTGRNATGEQAQEAVSHVRLCLAATAGAEIAERTRLLYGGSVTPDNASDVLAGPDVDGALVGGASLEPASFLAIVAALGSRS